MTEHFHAVADLNSWSCRYAQAYATWGLAQAYANAAREDCGESAVVRCTGVTYQVTLDDAIDSEHPNGHRADLAAKKLFTSRRATGKVVTIRRSDGATPYAS
jgi:hypothetical protein